MSTKIGIIIVAGGNSSRFGTNKLLEKIGGIPVILHSIINFNKLNYHFRVVLVCNKEYLDIYRKLISEFNITTPLDFVEGGKTRYESVICGLKVLDDDIQIVAIHDAARPLTSANLLERCVSLCKEKGTAVAAKKSTDTIKRCVNDNEVIETIDRSSIWNIETPQVFIKRELIRAYDYIIEKQLEVTDDAMAMELYGKKVFLLENPEPNFKITKPEDLDLLNYFYSKIQSL